MSCSICIEKFTKQPHRKEAKCPYCDIKACTTCTQTYLIGTHEDPHCMGCRRGWTREVLDTILLTTWINGDYKKRREDILFDRERSRLPMIIHMSYKYFINFKMAAIHLLLVKKSQKKSVVSLLCHALHLVVVVS
jgi:hypothetical protein